VTSNKTDEKMNAPAKASGSTILSPEETTRADDGRPASLPSSSAGGASETRPLQMPDRWFDEQLSRMFNDVSTEPLPPDLAKLVGQLRGQGNKSGDK